MLKCSILKKKAVSAMYDEYKKYIKEKLFFMPFGTHGIGHTRRVLNLALELAKYYNVPAKDMKVLAIACCYHDIGRLHDATDDEHGAISSEKMLKMKLDQLHNLTPDELSVILDLVVYHSMDDDLWLDDDNLLIYQILKDADALDRLRFNDLDVKYLRLAYSKELIPYATSLLEEDGVLKKK